MSPGRVVSMPISQWQVRDYSCIVRFVKGLQYGVAARGAPFACVPARRSGADYSDVGNTSRSSGVESENPGEDRCSTILERR